MSSPTPSVTRREFARRVAVGGAAALALGAAKPLLGADSPASTPTAAGPVRRGVWRAVQSPQVLTTPATLNVPPGESWCYHIPYVFQVAPRLAGISLNIKPWPGLGQDFEAGADLLLFDDLGHLHPERAIPLTRNHDEPNPNADGKLGHMSKAPVQIGFVPWGARRADGSPHPHAGTGFAVSNATARPVDDSEEVVNFPDRTGRSTFKGKRAFNYIERFQLGYDGKELTVGGMERLKSNEVVDGYELIGRGISAAIPDGDDLLLPMQAHRLGAAKNGAGISRWRRMDGRWRPVAFEMITPEDNSAEPSLVRDLDGSLLFLGRGRRDAGPPVRIWRRAAGATQWELKLNQNGLTNSTPITLNAAADGTPYVLMNLRQPEFKVPPGIPSDGGISRLEPKGWRGERSTVCLWALNDARDGFQTPLLLKDPLVEYGVPPKGTIWAADHTSATVVQLADGEWHSVYGLRVLEWIENTHFTPRSPQTGAHFGEVISLGPPVAAWQF